MNSDIAEEAARWIVRRDRGPLSDAEQAELDAWLDQHIAHRVAFLKIELAWQKSDRLRSLEADDRGDVISRADLWSAPEVPPPNTASDTPDDVEPAHIKVPEAGASERASRKAGLWPLALAAAIVAFTIGSFVLVHASRPSGGTHLATPVGAVANLALKDGSKVTLNTDTSMFVAFSDSERRIEMERGEAFFDVANDVTRPFTVYAGKERVRVLATKFSVHLTDDGVEVVVTQGCVKLASADVERLCAGSIAHASGTHFEQHSGPIRDAEKLLSWRDGYLDFENKPLADAVAEFNRYHARKIVVADPSIAAISFGGRISIKDMNLFLSMMPEIGVKVEQTDDSVVLTGDRGVPKAK
jgi:transmembrane sensor